MEVFQPSVPVQGEMCGQLAVSYYKDYHQLGKRHHLFP